MPVDFIGDGIALRSKGDIVSSDGTADIVIPVGTNGQILTAQSTTVSGLAWLTPTTQPATYMESIASACSTANVASITFSSIPSGYRDLRLIMTAKGTTTASSASPASYSIKVNSSTGNIYSESRFGMAGNLTTNQINVSTGTASYTAQMSTLAGILPNNSASIPYTVGISWFDFHNYADTSMFKVVSFIGSGASPNNTASGGGVEIGNWQILTTSAITNIVITGNFIALTAAHLWGIK